MLRPVALFAVLVIVGCKDITGPDISSSPAPISATSPIALTTSLSSAVLQPGESVTITVTATNLADTTVTVVGGACTLPFVVSTRFGRAVGPEVSHPPCPDVLVNRILAPHESISIPDNWDGTLTGDVRTRVAAGDYVVSGSTQFGPVRSNPPAELTILP